MKDLNHQILEKLDLILKVLCMQVNVDKSLTERAKLFKKAGLDNQTIADVLDTSYKSISVLTANKKTKK